MQKGTNKTNAIRCLKWVYDDHHSRAMDNQSIMHEELTALPVQLLLPDLVSFQLAYCLPHACTSTHIQDLGWVHYNLWQELKLSELALEIAQSDKDVRNQKKLRTENWENSWTYPPSSDEKFQVHKAL